MREKTPQPKPSGPSRPFTDNALAAQGIVQNHPGRSVILAGDDTNAVPRVAIRGSAATIAADPNFGAATLLRKKPRRRPGVNANGGGREPSDGSDAPERPTSHPAAGSEWQPNPARCSPAAPWAPRSEARR